MMHARLIRPPIRRHVVKPQPAPISKRNNRRGQGAVDVEVRHAISDEELPSFGGIGDGAVIPLAGLDERRGVPVLNIAQVSGGD